MAGLTASDTLVNPKRGEPFVDSSGITNFESQKWIEQVTRAITPGAVQRKTEDYTLSIFDAGVSANPDSGDINITLPDATKTKGLEFYVQNEGATGQVKMFPISGQRIAGSDAIIIPASIPFSSPFVKSDGVNWVLLGFLSGDVDTVTAFWVDDNGDQMIDETGDELIFIT